MMIRSKVMTLSKVPLEIQDGRRLDPMGQYLAMGTSKFLNNTHERSLKCRLKNILLWCMGTPYSCPTTCFSIITTTLHLQYSTGNDYGIFF